MPLKRPRSQQHTRYPNPNITYSRFNVFTHHRSIRHLRHAVFDQPPPYRTVAYMHQEANQGRLRSYLTYYTEQVVRSLRRTTSLHPDTLAFIPEQFRGLFISFILVLDQAYGVTGNILRSLRQPNAAINISFSIEALDSGRWATLGRGYRRDLNEDNWDQWVRKLIDAIQLTDDHDNTLEMLSQSDEEMDWENAKIVGQWVEDLPPNRHTIPITRSILAGGRSTELDRLYKNSIGPLDHRVQGLNAFDPDSVFPDRQAPPEYSKACAHISFIIAFSPFFRTLFHRDDWQFPCPTLHREYNRVYSPKHLIRNKNNLLYELIDYFADLTRHSPATWVDLCGFMERFLVYFPGHRVVILDPKDKAIRFACQGQPLPNTDYHDTHYFLYNQKHIDNNGNEKGHVYHYKPPASLNGHCKDCYRTICDPQFGCDFWCHRDPLRTFENHAQVDSQDPETKDFENDVLCNHCDQVIGPMQDAEDGVYKVKHDHSHCPQQSPDVSPLKECQQFKYDPFPISLKDPKISFQRNEQNKGKRFKQPITAHAWDMECMAIETTMHQLRNQRRQYLGSLNYEGYLSLEPEEEPIHPEDVCPIHEHVPNFINVQTLFTENTYDFHTMDGFLTFLLRAARPGCEAFPSKSKHIFIAHNSKGYDSRLLYIALLPRLTPEIMLRKPIKRGSKFLRLELFFPTTQTTFIFMDSMCHIAQSLKKMPYSLGVDAGNIKKGDFPHAFNTPTNQDYKGPLPAIQFYEHVEKLPDAKIQFEEDYQAMATLYRHQDWDFQTELKTYCQQDVRILRLCMEKYYRLFYEKTGLNPLLCTTAPAFALKSYMHANMPYGKLMVLDPKFLKHARKALRGGRTDVRCRYKKLSPEELVRGCMMVYQDVQSLYPSVMFFANPFPTGTPQRYDYNETQGTAMEDIADNDKFKHMFTHTPDNFASFFTGFVTCDIQCVDYIHHPVIVHNNPKGRLVANYQDKVQLTLTSVELYYALKTKCYRVTKVYIIDEYDSTYDLFKSYIQTWLQLKIESSKHQFQKGDKSPEQRYAEFLQLQEETKRVTGIELVYENMVPNEGLKTIAKLMLNSLWGKLGQKPDARETVLTDLDKQKMEEMIKCGFIEKTTAEHYESLGSKQQNSMVSFDIKDYRYLSQTSSVPVAAFVAAYGRIELWKELNKLGKRVLYHDTDSIIYLHEPSLYNIPENNVLGGWELEVTLPKKITEFVGVAPKTYGIKVQDGESMEEMIKCKGFPLNWVTTMDPDNAEKVNFSAYRDLVMTSDPEKVIHTAPGTYFEFNLQMQFMGTTKRQKKLTGVYEKGVVCPSTFCTYGEGWDRWGATSFAELDDSPRPC